MDEGEEWFRQNELLFLRFLHVAATYVDVFMNFLFDRGSWLF